MNCERVSIRSSLNMTPIFHGNFKNGEFALEPDERRRFMEHCRGKKDGPGELLVREKREHSRPYHRYFFGVIVGMVAKHFSVKPLDAYIMLMQTFRPLVTEGAELKFSGISTMDTAEMIELGEEIRESMFHEYQLRIPEPNEIEMRDDHELQSRYA